MDRLLIFSILLALCALSVRGLTDQDLARFNSPQITSVTKDGDNIVIKSTGIPDHATGTFPNPDNPNAIIMANHTATVPRNPSPRSGEPGCLPMGLVGMAVNGIPFFNPYRIDGVNAVEGDDREIFDSCEGHPNPLGEYHYHHVPVCLNGINETDTLVGVAIDGYPIYGPKRGDGKYMTSADLDICHGTTYQGSYRYYITSDFPYILGCLRGTAGTATSDADSDSDGPPPGLLPPPGGANGGRPMEPEDMCYYAFDIVKGQTSFSTASVVMHSNVVYTIALLFFYIRL